MKRLLFLPLAFALLSTADVLSPAEAASPKKKMAKKETDKDREATPIPDPVPQKPESAEPEGRSLVEVASSAVSTVISFPRKLLSPLIPFKTEKKESLSLVLTGIPKSLESGQTIRINFSADITNSGKKPVSLDFDSNLRMNASIEQQSGERVSSTAYIADTTPDPTSLTVNPTEKIRCELSLPLEKPLKGSLYTLRVKVASENFPLEAKANILVR